MSAASRRTGSPSRGVAVAALLLLGGGGCSYGLRAAGYGPATTPDGATVAVRVRGERTDRLGELLAADSAGLVLRGARLVRVPWTSVAALDVAGQGARFDVRWGERVTDAKWRRLALISRFPQGLEGELLRRVLAGLGQDSVERVP